MTIEAVSCQALSPADAQADLGWVEICSIEDLYVDRGSAALVAGKQVAVFRLESGEVYGLCQKDPYSEAFVMSRGIVGSRGDAPQWRPPCTSRSSTSAPASVWMRWAANHRI